VSEFLRRALDMVLAVVGLACASPVLAVAAVAIKLESRGPVLFRQVRIGRGQRPFVLYKLRGMYSDAEHRWPELYDYEGLAADGSDMQFHNRVDPRVTRVGRFLRATSIDELPNLVNVLKGDMHLVGPRPEIPEMLPLYEGERRQVFSVKPGVTSLPKSIGRDELTFGETVDLDLEYIRNRSLRLDLQILLRTARMVAFQRGVLPGGPPAASAWESERR
jgi:lipopolysaccharide/colanic/teichoic acid biosynthesis glycosyltransferase